MAIYALVLASFDEWIKVAILTLLFMGIDLLINEQTLSLVLQPSGGKWIDYGYWSTLFLILSMSLVYSRQRLQQAQKIEENNGFLMGFYQAISSKRGRDQIVLSAYEYFKHNLHLDVMVYLPHQQSLQLVLPREPNLKIDEKEFAIMQWVYQSGLPAGLGTGNLIFSEALFLPLKGIEACQGVMRFESQTGRPLSSFQRKNLMVCLQQLANILEIEWRHETEKAKDFSVIQTKIKDDLLSGFALQLHQPFMNLLALLPKKLENSPYKQVLHRLSNHLKVIGYFGDKDLLEQVSLQSMPDVIQQVLNAHSDIWSSVELRWYVQEHLPKVRLQLDLMSVVIENILDNILQHANVKDGVEISIHQKHANLLVSFADFGPGFSESELAKVFDYFYQVNARASPDGLGLGLALCERIITWHGGKIWAENRYPRGAIFNFTLPLEKEN